MSGEAHYLYAPPPDPRDDQRTLPAKCQDLIIGSGPSASVIAAYLAKAGRNVVLLEEGPARDNSHYKDHLAPDTFARMYQTNGGFPIMGGPGTPPIVLQLGRCKGGGTVVNGAVCYRTDPEVVDEWRDELHLEHLAREIWDGFARAEKRIGVTSMGELHSLSALKVREGAKKLGWDYHDVHRNTPGCRGTSRCISGCVSNAKQSMLITYLKDAEEHGAVCYTDTRVTKIEGTFGKVRSVRGMRAGKTFHLQAERIFCAGGGVMTPFLMLKSGIKHLRAIGRHLTIHPSTRAYYVFDEVVNASQGAFQSFAVHEFRDEGIHIISLFPPPGAFAASLPAIGPELRTLLQTLPHIGIMGGLISDESEGRVIALPIFDAPIVRYTMQPVDKRKMLRCICLLGELGFAAGAREVYLPFNWRPAVLDMHELEHQLSEKISPHDFEITAQHPLGTCRMGYDEDLSVVREDGRVHGYENLYVIDSSVIPTSIGVNPMLTVLAVAEVIGASLT